MKAADAARAAGAAIAANPLRSTLTALGVIIGVAAVIVMLAVGSGARERVEGFIRNLGSNVLVVFPQQPRGSGASFGASGGSSFNDGDVAAIRAQITGLRAVDPTVQGGAQIVGGFGNWSTSVQGVTPDHAVANNLVVASGRFLDDADVRSARTVVVIGPTVARELFGDADPIGERIRLNRTPFTVIGLLAPRGQTGWGQDQDDTALVPISTARSRVLGRQGRSDTVRTIRLSVENEDDMARVQSELEELLRLRRDIRPGAPDDFRVQNLAAIADASQQSTAVFSILLGSVAGVSLLVGGIGIMNIMLVSVTERTREIGLRMALGAKRGDILTQFTLEAIVLSLVGGVLGAAIGMGGAAAFSSIGQWKLIIEPWSVGMAVGFSALVGLVFGAYPARRAARLDPIEALRRE